jgi:hypothetical protein
MWTGRLSRRGQRSFESNAALIEALKLAGCRINSRSASPPLTQFAFERGRYVADPWRSRRAVNGRERGVLSRSVTSLRLPTAMTSTRIGRRRTADDEAAVFHCAWKLLASIGPLPYKKRRFVTAITQKIGRL